MVSAQEYINKLGLKPHPEGGYFAECYRSTDAVQPLEPRYHGEKRVAGTSIYYLLEKQDFSAWHRVNSDEIWHHYTGCSIKIHQIDAQGKLSTIVLGDPVFQVCIPAGTWFAAELSDKTAFALVGCTVSPGFEFADFELATRDVLTRQFPKHASFIQALVR